MDTQQQQLQSHSMPLTPPFSGSFKTYTQSEQIQREVDEFESLGPALLDLDCNQDQDQESAAASILSSASRGFVRRDDGGVGKGLGVEGSTITDPGRWRPNMTFKEKMERREYLMEGNLPAGEKRRGLRVIIVTENFLPKVDGVTRTLSLLINHLSEQGHECILLGPESGMETYGKARIYGTWGIPLPMYPSLKLNFLRPRFLSRIRGFDADVVVCIDPIWLVGQVLYALRYGWGGKQWAREELGVESDDELLEGAIVASYHTNIATYASLFGMPFLEPLIWKLQRRFYTKAFVTLCPSPSTASMLNHQGFGNVRIWPRGVDLSQFSPMKRDVRLRSTWGVKTKGVEGLPASSTTPVKNGLTGGMPITPPLTPQMDPVDAAGNKLEDRLIALYVGRVSWEKNLHLLIRALEILPSISPDGSLPPKMVFVGDGPARSELEYTCREKGIDALFLGHKSGEELATCFASADVFLFPSFTETFGQVVTEAMASGLPVIGLDADGTRDLVTHGSTGLLLSPPKPKGRILPTVSVSEWPRLLTDRKSERFEACAMGYAELIVRATKKGSDEEREGWGRRAATEGVQGRTWYDAMELCVDGFREALRMAQARREARVARVKRGMGVSVLMYTSRKTNLVILTAALILLICVLIAEFRYL